MERLLIYTLIIITKPLFKDEKVSNKLKEFAKMYIIYHVSYIVYTLHIWVIIIIIIII